MSALGSIALALCPWIEPWMDVLLIGFSADALSEHGAVAKVHCARSQRRPIAGTFDCVAVWLEDRPALPLEIHFEKLRGGGLLALGMPRDLDAALVQEFIASLSQSHQCLQDGAVGTEARLLVFRQTATGPGDLFGLRRARHRLMASLQRVERLAELAACTAQAARVAAMIADLADADRFHLQPWLSTLAHAATGDGATPVRGHRGRPLAEEAVRFRHFRSTTLERLAALTEEAWHAETQASRSAAQTVRAFADAEDRRLAEFEREGTDPGLRS